MNQGLLLCCKFAKTTIYNTNKNLVNDDVYTNLVSFYQFILKILIKNRILTSNNGSNSVANLRKTKIYNTNIDLVNDNVYTKFGLNLLFFPKILNKNQILTPIKGRNSIANLRKK